MELGVVVEGGAFGVGAWDVLLDLLEMLIVDCFLLYALIQFKILLFVIFSPCFLPFARLTALAP